MSILNNVKKLGSNFSQSVKEYMNKVDRSHAELNEALAKQGRVHDVFTGETYYVGSSEKPEQKL